MKKYDFFELIYVVLFDLAIGTILGLLLGWDVFFAFFALLYGAKLFMTFYNSVRLFLGFYVFKQKDMLKRRQLDLFNTLEFPKKRHYGEDGLEYLNRVRSDEKLPTKVRMNAAHLTGTFAALRSVAFIKTFFSEVALDAAVNEYAVVEPFQEDVGDDLIAK